ncbi:hypothetical protein ACEN2P_21300 [Pedobacter psychrotolerans]|uniref:ORC-CDC6 family AAA ATPase n=1 Tax=Pedobacter psychrotolerans TaxID=1843235 RepID=UPI003F96CB93
MNVEDFYATYNARHLNPKEVAETFIWSDSFEKLIQNNHSVILGARGCGKTTLMKMLTLPALYSWQDEKAKQIRENIKFYGIYISTDIYWDVKNKTYSSQLKKFRNFSHLISVFSVNSNVFTSLCDTFLNIIEFEIDTYSQEKEIELCIQLIKAWKLSDSIIPKIKYIKEALNERIDTVNQLIQDVIFNYNNEDDIPRFDYFNLSFESSLELLIPIFERIFDIEDKKNWALCFDELEFAPIWLTEILFKSLRSRKQYILYKLSSSPILPTELEIPLKAEYGASSGNDLKIIKMWTSKDNDRFSMQLIDSLLMKKNNEQDSASFFGSNDIYNKHPDSYLKNSSFYKETVSLLKKDQSFKEFLLEKRVDINNPIPINNEQKDVLFRKIKPIVYFRNFYLDTNRLTDGSFDSKQRRRKSGELFSGIEILTKVCDGNPRWLIGIINGILTKSHQNKASIKVQFDELFLASKRFENVIANIPIGLNTNLTLIDIIKKIGTHFQNELLGGEFVMDPNGTFIVDKSKQDVPDAVIELLEKGISQGAIILLSADEESFDFKIRGERFKLSYLFFLLYKLPIRKYNPVKLSECLKGVKNEPKGQISLFK